MALYNTLLYFLASRLLVQDTGRFDAYGVTAYTGDLRTLFEIHNTKEAYELFLSAFQARRPLDEASIKELQFCLAQNTYDTRRCQLGERPGEYKCHDYVTGGEGVRSHFRRCGRRGAGAAGCSLGERADSGGIFPRQI